jgi:hypothetical protein
MYVICKISGSEETKNGLPKKYYLFCYKCHEKYRKILIYGEVIFYWRKEEG